MSRFIKLSNMIINTSKIININIYPHAIYINIHGSSLSGYNIFYFGILTTQNNIISIYKDNNQNDYNIVKDWIDKLA